MAMLEAETNRVRVVHGSVLNPSIAARWAEFHVDDQTPLCDAIRSGLPVLLPSVETLGQRYPNLLADTLAASLSATASLPLHTPNGACLGAIGFGWPRPQAFGPTQVRRLDLIAQMAAQALDRAMLYERERGQPSADERAEAHLLQEAFCRGSCRRPAPSGWPRRTFRPVKLRWVVTGTTRSPSREGCAWSSVTWPATGSDRPH
jgi:GAF domain-containing protein